MTCSAGVLETLIFALSAFTKTEYKSGKIFENPYLESISEELDGLGDLDLRGDFDLSLRFCLLESLICFRLKASS